MCRGEDETGIVPAGLACGGGSAIARQVAVPQSAMGQHNIGNDGRYRTDRVGPPPYRGQQEGLQVSPKVGPVEREMAFCGVRRLGGFFFDRPSDISLF